MNNLIAPHKEIEWTTTDGFHVVHQKKKTKNSEIKLTLPSSRKSVTILKRVPIKGKNNTAKMKSSISPNVIHSYDAELLRKTAGKMRDMGIVDSDWIHDSFGCNPNNVDLMLKLTKGVFKEFVSVNQIQLLDEILRAQAEAAGVSEKDLAKVTYSVGDFDFETGLDKLALGEFFFS
jgi:DNA-directed RNA polymerase